MSSRRCHTYQPCDTFFVESYGGFPAPGLDLKQHAKMIARQRQYAIKDELSRIASDEFRDDILAHLLEMDVSFPPTPHFVSSLIWLTGLPDCNSSRCGVHRYSNRNPVVHASVPSGLLDRGPCRLPTPPQHAFLDDQYPRPVLLEACCLQEALPVGWVCVPPHRCKVRR